ncbi:hypothetical protein [Tessaracoccus flavus]|uniref:Uncharacterized protein n=1 Tax=Tessaracoccus flavus TaxID=1610493 RepID=A0A1Q2CCC5_9ACTN|nr:hypothetical protein [Tessaracoccus flavus]AQP43768.1 hypothetical protein RPIT_02190 [Tessaracoccus flavus]SDY23419.1 hypothetical protein SAMN05428934_10137 [Tessaracoccus flavus]
MWEQIGELFGDLAAAGGQIVVDAWVAICIAVWGAGLWVMRAILQLGDWFLTPNLNPDGSSSALWSVYGVTLWLGLSLALMLLIVQLVGTVLRRDALSLASAVWGSVKFLLVCTLWYTYGAALVTAVEGLNTALRLQLLGTADLADWEPTGLDFTEGVMTGTTATVLMLLGLVLWLAALAHLVVMLGRAVSLIVIAATAPIAAAGLMFKPFESWFWKAFRWFHAAAIAPLLMTLMLGLGVRLATGVSLGMEDSGQEAVALALPSVVMIAVAALSPVALFRLLAFVDPGTTSGASFRAGLAGTTGASSAASYAHTAMTRSSGSGSGGGGVAGAGESATASRTAAAQSSSLSPGAAGGAAASGGAGGSAAGVGGAAAGGTSAGGAAAGGAAAGGGAATGAAAGVGAVAGPVGVVAAGVILGAKKLVDGFQQVGARATGLVNDTTSGMGAGDPSYPYDPAGDIRRTPHPAQPHPAQVATQTTSTQPQRAAQPPVAVREAEDHNGGQNL